jgi:phage-related protein
VLAVTIDHDGNTWRLAYTLAMPKEIWVLHFFQKKAKRGIANPKRDMDLIERRFKELMALRRRKQH